MPSTYPTTLDALPTAAANGDTSLNTHPALHNDANAAINAVQETLGTNPQGAAASVSARIAAVEGATGAATTTAAGLVELATVAEAEAGTDTARAVTAAGVAAAIAALGGGASTITNVYLAAGSPHTWTKDPAAKQVDVYLVGPGAGGCSGQVASASSTGSGGGGGGSGAIVLWSFAASELPSSVTVTVTASTGGAAVGPTAAVGLIPTQPGDVTFGSILKAKAGLVASTYNLAGAAVGSANLLRGGNTFATQAGSGSGMPSSNVSGSAIPGTPAAGSGGAGVWNSGIAYGSGNGGTWANATTIFPTLASATGAAAGANGNAGMTGLGLAGLGGSGGGSSFTGNAGSGGAGGFPGGGGGGGGSCWAGFMSGAGGKGGDGICIVIQRL